MQPSPTKASPPSQIDAPPRNPRWPHASKRLLPWLIAVAFFMESLDTTILNTGCRRSRRRSTLLRSA